MDVMDRELTRLTAAGWQIVSQSETAFQVMYPHYISSVGMALFVIAPLGLGVFVSLASPVFGTVLFWIALLVAVLMVLDHLSNRPKLLYITAAQLQAPATLEQNAKGLAICSVCSTANGKNAPTCRTCGIQFAK